MPATRKEKGGAPHARDALAQDNLYPRIAALSRRVRGAKKVIPVSARFCWVKLNGHWLCKTRQIVTGRNKRAERGSLWGPNRRAQILSGLRSVKPIHRPKTR